MHRLILVFIICLALPYCPFAGLRAMEQDPDTSPSWESFAPWDDPEVPLYWQKFLAEMRSLPDSESTRDIPTVLATLKRYNGTNIILLGQPCELCHTGIGDTDKEGALRLPCGHGVHYKCMKKDLMRHGLAMCWICVVSADPDDH